MINIIGSNPDQISLNGMLGTLAFQDSAAAYIQKLAVGSQGSTVSNSGIRFPNASLVSSTINSSTIQQNESHNIGILGEGLVDSGTGTNWGVGVYGVGYTRTNTSGTARAAGVVGESHVSASADTLSAIGVRSYSNDVHSGGANIGLYAEATNGASNYALYMNAGDIFSNTAQTWTLNTGNLSFAGSYPVITTPAPISTSAATYSVVTNASSIIFGAACTVTLPTASANTGRMLYVKTTTAAAIISASSNVVAKTGGAAGTALLPATAGATAMIQSDGTNWTTMLTNF